MLHTLRFSLQNAVYFIMLHFLVHVLFTFYIQVCQNLNVKLGCQKVKLVLLFQVLTYVFTTLNQHNTTHHKLSVLHSQQQERIMSKPTCSTTIRRLNRTYVVCFRRVLQSLVNKLGYLRVRKTTIVL
jgi:hypothetical protein